ncbi:MAG: pyridoxal-phosphate dependent enzyme, partial [Psychrosphaera sp.]|nr:pyridoxal-phosphate dependent enzyme [Psychrosphaera sp.]
MTNLHINTPLIEAPGMSLSPNTKVWLKMDALQPSGSFKNRGVGLACQAHQARGATALVSSSGGNAGLAVAYSGRQLGMPVTVVVPESTKQRAIDLMNQQGAKVIITGKIWDEAHEHAMTLVNDQTAYIHPFDDPLLWQGHASIIDEVVEAGVNPDAVVLSVGGGGLLCGVIEGLKRNGLNNTPVVAVETQGAHSLSTAMRAQQHIGIDNIDSIATSLGAKIVAKQAF